MCVRYMTAVCTCQAGAGRSCNMTVSTNHKQRCGCCVVAACGCAVSQKPNQETYHSPMVTFLLQASVPYSHSMLRSSCTPAYACSLLCVHCGSTVVLSCFNRSACARSCFDVSAMAASCCSWGFNCLLVASSCCPVFTRPAAVPCRKVRGRSDCYHVLISASQHPTQAFIALYGCTWL